MPHEDKDFEDTLDRFAEVLADEVMVGKEESALERTDDRREREREKVKEEVAEYCDRFEKGYEALLQELMSLNEE